MMRDRMTGSRAQKVTTWLARRSLRQLGEHEALAELERARKIAVESHKANSRAGRSTLTQNFEG